MKKVEGVIIDVHRNYGEISTNAFKGENDEIYPFAIEQTMIAQGDNGEELIRYTREVEFTVKSNYQLRGRAIRIATDVRFIGTDLQEFKRPSSEPYLQTVRSVFHEHLIDLPELSDKYLYEFLKQIGFQPRMLDIVSSNWIFPSRTIYSMKLGECRFEDYDTDIESIRFDPRIIPVIDAVDSKFRAHLIEWITRLENSYKDFFCRISSQYGQETIADYSIAEWKCKKTDKETGRIGKAAQKQMRRAQQKRLFRQGSELIDLVKDEDKIWLADFLEQLDLGELREYVDYFKESSRRASFFSPWLENMAASASMLSDLSELRNAAAHGRPILVDYGDPDYNANWDLEFDSTGSRNMSLKRWALYAPLEKIWSARTSESTADSLIGTVYGNPLRRAWMELNFLFCTIVAYISPKSYEQYVNEVSYFLEYDAEDSYESLKRVNTTNLRLADFGPTTGEQFTGIAPINRVIANEAYDIWSICNDGEWVSNLYQPLIAEFPDL